MKTTLNEVAEKLNCREDENKKELLEIRKKIKDNDESKRRTIDDKTTELKETLNQQGESIQKLEDEVQEKNPKIIVVEETEVKDNDTIATCGAGTGVSGIRIISIKHFVEYFKKFFSTKEENNNSITNEATTRANEDKKLQTNITNEVNARSSAINSEATTRANAINSEATTRANEDKKLQTSITNEVNARSSAINSVNTTISNLQKTISSIPVGATLNSIIEKLLVNGAKRSIYGTWGLLGGATESGKHSFDDVMNEVSQKGGICGGSFYDTQNRWYNFLYIPHRHGVGGDNTKYGSCLFFDMTSNTGNIYLKHRVSGSNQPLITFNANSSSAISSEATTRANEDKKLQTSITNETTTRANEDKKLLSTINANMTVCEKTMTTEKKERTGAIDALTTKYNSLGTSYSNLNTKYNSLNSNYNTLNSNYNTLNSNYNSLKTTVTNLQNELNTVGGWEILCTTTGSGNFGAWKQDELSGIVAFKVKGYVSTRFNASDLKRNFTVEQQLLKADNFSLWNDYPWFIIKSENSSFNRSEKIIIYYKIFK